MATRSTLRKKALKALLRNKKIKKLNQLRQQKLAVLQGKAWMQVAKAQLIDARRKSILLKKSLQQKALLQLQNLRALSRINK